MSYEQSIFLLDKAISSAAILLHSRDHTHPYICSLIALQSKIAYQLTLHRDRNNSESETPDDDTISYKVIVTGKGVIQQKREIAITLLKRRATIEDLYEAVQNELEEEA
jgi:hypothetical protein